ncbi:hypothetical protein L218DRAFT_944171 [Marasmius fiardii PR-910]|nr:hypothetical protein L218DRAFT_944171 [Marasmius fiardii PR-910]
MAKDGEYHGLDIAYALSCDKLPSKATETENYKSITQAISRRNSGSKTSKPQKVVSVQSNSTAKVAKKTVRSANYDEQTLPRVAPSLENQPRPLGLRHTDDSTQTIFSRPHHLPNHLPVVLCIGSIEYQPAKYGSHRLLKRSSLALLQSHMREVIRWGCVALGPWLGLVPPVSSRELMIRKLLGFNQLSKALKVWEKTQKGTFTETHNCEIRMGVPPSG